MDNKIQVFVPKCHDGSSCYYDASLDSKVAASGGCRGCNIDLASWNGRCTYHEITNSRIYINNQDCNLVKEK